MAETGRYPLEPVLRHFTSLREAAAALHVSERTLRQLRRDGATAEEADQLAVWIGQHPASIWPEWLHDPDGEELPPEPPAYLVTQLESLWAELERHGAAVNRVPFDVHPDILRTRIDHEARRIRALAEWAA